ncbi:YciI family protein [Pelagibius sp. Alg239-R121]|uniref:YciI family protein n=1 Tax=Pelagibius sp. Alg239-R121 TaxID=2993448 RepID=UPI0024A73E47|nr:YciI family protein [Pelagibius sp. Alg239-R121]
MNFAVLFEDDDSRADKRAEHMSAHLAFLEANTSNISTAGPLTDTSDGSSAGGLWLVTAESAEAVQELVEQDPFWPTGLRKAVRILKWTQVFADGKRQI